MTLDLRTLWHTRRTALLGGAAAVLVAGGGVGAVVATSSTGGTTVLAQVRAPLDTPATDDAAASPAYSPSPSPTGTPTAVPSVSPTVSATIPPRPAATRTVTAVVPATTAAPIPTTAAPAANSTTVLVHDAAAFGVTVRFSGAPATGGSQVTLQSVTLAAGASATVHLPPAGGPGEGLSVAPADDAECGDGNGGEQIWSAGETDHLEISGVTGGCRNGTPGVTKDGVLFVMTFPDGHTFRSQG
ncbi:MAG TPA: hypothetical protein VGD03_07035 [Frankiaceae bacterium]